MPAGKNKERLELAMPEGTKAVLQKLASEDDRTVKAFAEKVILDFLRAKGLYPLVPVLPMEPIAP